MTDVNQEFLSHLQEVAQHQLDKSFLFDILDETMQPIIAQPGDLCMKSPTRVYRVPSPNPVEVPPSVVVSRPLILNEETDEEIRQVAVDAGRSIAGSIELMLLMMIKQAREPITGDTRDEVIERIFDVIDGSEREGMLRIYIENPEDFEDELMGYDEDPSVEILRARDDHETDVFMSLDYDEVLAVTAGTIGTINVTDITVEKGEEIDIGTTYIFRAVVSMAVSRHGFVFGALDCGVDSEEDEA